MIPAQKSAFVQLCDGNVWHDMGLYECCDDDASIVRLCTVVMIDGMTVMTKVFTFRIVPPFRFTATRGQVWMLSSGCLLVKEDL